MTNRRKAQMQAEPGQRPAGFGEATFRLLPLIKIVLILTLPSGCERPSTAKGTTTPQQQVSLVQRTKQAQAHDDSARAAFALGDYDRCESTFVASARLGVPIQRAQSLYGASRCAARTGRFQMSLFHLHAAASAGFGNYLLVVNDPLLRPLRGHPRWQLVLGLIEENFRTSDAVAPSELSPAIKQVSLAISFTRAPPGQGPA